MNTSSIGRERRDPTVAKPSDDLLERIGLGVTICVHAGGTIVIEGDPIDHCFRILSGSVHLYKAVADGRRQIIDFLGATDGFGVIGQGEHACSVEAITDVVMVRYSRHSLEAAITEEPVLGRWLFRLACTELSRAQQRMLLLGRKNADERVASFLVDLAARRSDGEGNGTCLHLPMSRQDIADHLGLTIETVSRIFTRFKRARLVDLPDRHAVVLTDVDRLSRLADGGFPVRDQSSSNKTRSAAPSRSSN